VLNTTSGHDLAEHLDTDSRYRARLTPSGRGVTGSPNPLECSVLSTYRDRSGPPAGSRAKRPRGDGSKGAATGPITVSEVTQSEDCGRHPKMSWEEELPIPLQQYGGS